MKIIRRLLLNLLNLVWLLFLLWILLGVAGRIPGAKHLTKEWPAYLWTIPGACLLLGVFFFIRMRSKGWLQGKCKLLIVLLAFFLLAGQLAFLYYVRFFSGKEELLLVQEALRMGNDGLLDGKFAHAYFQKYPYSHGAVLLLYWVYQFWGKFGIESAYWLSHLLSLFLLDSSFFLGGLCLSKAWSLREVVLFQILLLVCPMSYLGLAAYDSLLVFLPLVMGAVYCLIAMKEAKNLQRRMLWSGTFVFLACLGVCIRPICMLLPFLYLLKGALSSSKRREFFTRILPINLVLAAGLLSLLMMIDRGYAPFVKEGKAYPVTYYVMMGLRGDGMFREENHQLLEKTEKRAEMISLQKKEIGRSLKEKNCQELAIFAGNKLWSSWGDASGGLLGENTTVYGGSLAYYYLCGDGNDLFLCYWQIYYLAILCLLIWGLLKGIFRTDSDLHIILVSFSLFYVLIYLVLAGNSRHVLGLFPILVTLAACSLGRESSFHRRIGGKKNTAYGKRSLEKRWPILVYSLLAAAFLILVSLPFYQKSWTGKLYSVKATADIEGKKVELRRGDSFIQTFSTELPFDHIKIEVETEASGQEPACMLELLDGKGAVLARREENLDEVKEEGLAMTFPTRIPRKKEIFTLRAEILLEGGSLAFSKAGGPLEMLTGGSLQFNHESKEGNLLFVVYKEKTRAFSI